MSDFEDRFSFIKDATLRQNLTQIFEHVAELVLLIKLEHPISINKSFLRKSAIIWSAAIVESLIFHLLQKKDLWESFSEKWKTENEKKIYSVSDTEEIIWCHRKKIKLNKRTNFGEMIDVCENAKIFSKEESHKIRKVMKARNKIHLHTLGSVDSGITERELEENFKIARLVTNRIQIKLK